MPNVRGKSLKLIARDVSDGYTAINPLFLKPFEAETLKELYQEMIKASAEIRAEKFPHGEAEAIRWRNLRLQRLHTSAMIIRTYARDRRISLI